MKVKFRTYCQGCRYGIRGRMPLGSRSIETTRRDLCAWPKHRFEWECWIEQDGLRLIQRRGYLTREGAMESARRQWFRTALSTLRGTAGSVGA